MSTYVKSFITKIMECKAGLTLHLIYKCSAWYLDSLF